MTGPRQPDLLVSTDWLARNLGRPGLRVLDVRWRPDGTGRATFGMGHVPGATYLDWARELIGQEDQGTLMLLAPPDEMAEPLARAGINAGDTVVVYDDTMSGIAARVWWSLRTCGLEDVRILDGGMPAWIDEGRELSSATIPPPPGSFRPDGPGRHRLTVEQVRAISGSPNIQLLDARAPAEFLGHQGNARRLGHLPAAINVPVAAMHEPGSQRFLPAERLQAQITRAGVTRGRRLVCYDGSGVGAAKLAFVLALLGYDDVGVYDGGWAEWGDRLDLPVER
jgi:thiosulfate/3-mercaptopyruvate sulfurtransferase